MIKFWNFKTLSNQSKDDEGNENYEKENLLYIDGEIAPESWWGDEVTPMLFKEELNQVEGDLTVWINSPGGDVVAGSQIYTMLKEHKGDITVKIDGMAASAASVIAMAGDKVCMSPTAMMMIHNVSSFAFGNKNELAKVIMVLKEFEEAIINAYEQKTGMERAKIAKMMDNETWMNARKAIELGFADEMLYSNNSDKVQNKEGYSFSSASYISKLSAKMTVPCNDLSKNKIKDFEKRLNLLRR